MGISTSIVERIGAAAVPEGNVVLASRSGLRAAMRVGAGISLAAGAGLGLLHVRDGQAPGDAARRIDVLAPLALGLGLAGASLLVRPLTAPVVREGFTSTNDAVAAADALDRATGVMRTGDTFSVLDLQKHYNLDHLDLDKLRIGDGRVRFEALVTQDGDLLRPATSSAKGYVDMGAATAPVDLARLDPADPGAVSRALVGRQVGTDDAHRRLLVGTMAGSTTGYASAEDAARAVYSGNGALTGDEHLLANAGNRWFAFRLTGPARYDAYARGVTAGPLDRLAIQSGKAMYTSGAPRADFTFAERVLPFTTDEPIGRELYLHGVTASPRRYVDSYRDIDSALGQAQRLGWREGADGPGYAVVSGHTAQGDHHLYQLASGHGQTWWEDELGQVQAVQYHDSESRTVRDVSGQYIEHQERQLLRQMERDGQRVGVAEGDWRTTLREYDPDHKKPPYNLL